MREIDLFENRLQLKTLQEGLKHKVASVDITPNLVHGADLRARRKVLGKTAYTLRVKKLLRSARAQQVASNVALGFKRVCKQVVKNKGAASKA